MRFLSIYKTAERKAPPTQEEMDRMGRYIEQSMKAGEPARRFLAFTGEGECELRQLYEAPVNSPA